MRRHISFQVNEEEYALIQRLKKDKSYRELFLSALQVNEPPGPPEENIPQERLEAQARGELFYLPRQNDFVLVQLELDMEALPEYKLEQLHIIGGFDTAEAALKSYCQQGLELHQMLQTLLLHRSEGDWYYPAHVVLEVFPRLMNTFGDYDFYESLLRQYYLE